MPYLYEYNLSDECRRDLLAVREPGSFAESIAGRTIYPNSSRRTILIGLGGLGVKTLDHIKAALSSKFYPGWNSLVGFLAVDTDRYELSQTKHLSPNEMLLLAHPTHYVMPGNPHTWPRIWHAITDEHTAPPVVHMAEAGAGCKRLVGRLKLHDQVSGEPGFDEQVVDMLQSLAFSELSPLYDTSHYDVYVISSLYGGSGSGMFLDFPALIRHALRTYQVDIHAILYLPSHIPDNDDIYTANTYAALKELDFFQNLYLRDRKSTTFPHSDPTFPGLTPDSGEGMFQSVKLIYAAPHRSGDSHIEALNQVTRHILCGIECDPCLDSSLSDIIPPRALPHGSDGRVHFSQTILNACAALPSEILEAYQISKLCSLAGLACVSDSRRSAMIAEGAPLLPFRSSHQRDTPHQLNTDAANLLQPLYTLINDYLTPAFSYESVFSAPPTWDEIRHGHADCPSAVSRTNAEIQRQTSPAIAAHMREQVQQQFCQFRQNVRLYVEQHGPMAFVNLFRGRADCHEDSEFPKGIEKMLAESDFMLERCRQRLEHTLHALQDIRKRISSEPDTPMHRILHATRRHTMSSDWLHTYVEWADLRIFTIRLQMLLAKGGILDQFFLEPARRMTAQLDSFGHILENMTQAYQTHGAVMENFDAFYDYTSENCDINMGTLNRDLHAQLLRQLDAHILQQHPLGIRQGVVQDFFQNPDRWLEVDDSQILRLHNHFRLCDPRRPIAARKHFDSCIRSLFTLMPVPTVSDMFSMAHSCGISLQDYAYALLSTLNRRTEPRRFPALRPIFFNSPRYELVYPRSIREDRAESAVNDALVNAARNLQPEITIRGTHDSDSICLHRIYSPFELTSLRDLLRWERSYESILRQPNNGLHGYGPNVRLIREEHGLPIYQDETPWADLPNLTAHTRDPN